MTKPINVILISLLGKEPAKLQQENINRKKKLKTSVTTAPVNLPKNIALDEKSKFFT